ncbi:MAG: DNA-binding domain-containing protein [Woeseiaceae bacterium]
MTSLAKTQHRFQDIVLDEKPLDENQLTWVRAQGRTPVTTQVSVYQYAYRARLIEVLSNDYPAVLNAIGEESFETLAKNYIKQFPSHYFSLRDFGDDFAQHIKNSNDDTSPWLHELAMFEFHLSRAFDAANDKIFTEQDMAIVPAEAWPTMRFVLHSSVYCLKFKWNTVELWQALTQEVPDNITAQKSDTSTWLIWRENLTTQFRSMEENEHIAFDVLKQGGSFTELCEALASTIDEDEVPIHAASLLKGWISQSLISSVR